MTGRRCGLDARAIAGRFAIPGALVSIEPYGSGHINDTYLATYEAGGARFRYIQQRINTAVFTDPEALMDNVTRVVDHLASKARRAGGSRRQPRALRLVPAADGRPFHLTADGQYWRTFDFIDGAYALDVVERPAQAREAAAMFGRFQRQLADLPPPRLQETIAGFHDTGERRKALLQAASRDAHGRRSRCEAEIDFASGQAALADALTRQLASGALPERVTHNDTKLNNVLLDRRSGAGVCVIDLDTVMPGSALYDFGDMVRTATMTAPEDEPDPARIAMDRRLYEAVVEGYASGVRGWLSAAEQDSLALSARVMTFEVGIRFLTDFLNGDTYFRVGYPEHNLVRARAQFALLGHMRRESGYMEDVVRRAFDAGGTAGGIRQTGRPGD